MTYRIGWLSPLTPASGVGTFSHAVAKHFPTSVDGEPIDLTLLYPDHARLHDAPCRSVRIEDTDSFRNVLGLFDLLVYNIGNNTEHHETIFRLLRSHPGIVVCHDYVYQHYLADRSMHYGGSFASFAALLMKFGGQGSGSYLARSRITSRTGRIRYAPWDSEASASQPMSEAILALGSALVVHSRYAESHVARSFSGPILRLGMPYDQKPCPDVDTSEAWARVAESKATIHIVSFGHIQATKCIDLVLNAIASSALLRKRLCYTIAGFVGDWDYLRSLQDFVATERLVGTVCFEPEVSEKRLAEMMQDADLFMNLRRPNTEGSSASLIEQLESGRPVIVLDSGCYAEVPDEAAIKLPAHAGPDDIREALEALVIDQKRLPTIGRAGRAFARTWTCALYAERLVAFALENRELLQRRSAMVGVGRQARVTGAPEDDIWLEKLAQARSALRYLDCNVLMVDPQLIMSLKAEELCRYVGEVIFGIFDDARLHRSLIRFFVCRDGRAAYWACAKFRLLIEAVTGCDESAERLATIGACYDIDFWEVLDALPLAQYVTAASLMIIGRKPTRDEVEAASPTVGSEALVKRRTLLDLLQQVSSNGEPDITKLVHWLERPIEQQQDSELPPIEQDLYCVVGGVEFREHVDLSGFYPQESDHAWTRGARGFIGLRLGPSVRRVEVVIRSVNACATDPAVLALSSGTTSAEIEVKDRSPHALALDIPKNLARSDGTIWLQLSTSRAGAPVAHPGDARILGVCLMNLMVSVGALDELSRLA